MLVKAKWRLTQAALCVSIAAGVWAQSIPTIEVTSRFRVFVDEDAPGGEDALTVFAWKTTNATQVWIMGDRIHLREPNGEIDARRTGGEYLFVAVGPGGTASQYVVATLKSRPGTGRHGVIFNLHDEFSRKGLLENAFKHSLETTKLQSQLIKIALEVLQGRGYTVDLTQLTAGGPGALLYTKDYEFDSTIKQTPADEAKEGETIRQIAFVVWLTPISKQWWLYVLPMVKQNHPQDNSKWKPDRDMLQLGRPAATAVFNAIQAAAR